MNVLEAAVTGALINSFGNPLILAFVLLLLFFVLVSTTKLPIEIGIFALVPAVMFLFTSFLDINVRAIAIVLGMIMGIVVGLALIKIMRR